MPVPIPQASVFSAFGPLACFENLWTGDSSGAFASSVMIASRFDRAKVLTTISIPANKTIVIADSACEIRSPGPAFYDGGQGRLHVHLHLARRRVQPRLIGAGGTVVVVTTGK
jgi:hypothetical protein